MRTNRLRSPASSLILVALLGSALLAGTATTDAAGRWETTHRITRQTVPLDVCCAAAVAWSPKGDLLAVGGATLRLLRSDGRPVASLSGYAGAVASLSWSPDGTALAAGARDGTVQVVGADGRTLRTLRGQRGPINALAWSPDGHVLATGSADGTVRIWQRDGVRLTTLVGDSAPVQTLSWSPRGRSLVFGSGDTAWVKYVGGRTGPLLTPVGGLQSVAWSPDNALIATGGRDGIIRQWDSSSGALRGFFLGHTGSHLL